MTKDIEEDIRLNPDKYDYQDVPVSRKLVAENERAYREAWLEHKRKMDDR